MSEKKIETVPEKKEEVVSVADVQALLAKIQELEAKVENQGVKEIRVIEKEGKVSGNKPTKEQEAYVNERVPFFAFSDNDKYKDDIVVGINGYNYVIQRGKHVQIPRFVYDAIIDAERQRMLADRNSQNLIDSFMNESKKRGLV